MNVLTAEQEARQARKIRDLETRRRGLVRGECEVVARIGRELIWTKARMKGNRWKAWAKSELPFGYSTALHAMGIAEKVQILGPFFKLGRSIVYELLEVPEATLRKLTPDSVLRTGRASKPLREMDCCEVDLAVAILNGRPKREPSVTARGMGSIAALEKIRKSNPAAWGDLVDDVGALLGRSAPDCPPKPGMTVATTKEGRARAAVAMLEQAVVMIRLVRGGTGKLPPELKRTGMAAAKAPWREVNRWPAWVTLRRREAPPWRGRRTVSTGRTSA